MGKKEESTLTTNDENGARDGSKMLSVFLLFIGAVALCMSMWINARFGWRTTLAILHVLDFHGTGLA